MTTLHKRHAFFGLIYTLLWCLVGPLLFFSKRLRQNWAQRLGLDLPGFCDIWIQGASAGECALVPSLLAHLPKDISILVSTWTTQGLEKLEKIQTKAPFHTRMTPFDLPFLMGLALDTVRPRVVVLLETELWPGMLMACHARKIPVVVVNGRMTTASLAGYLCLRSWLRTSPPAAIAAISPEDARRFDLIFGPGRTTVAGNIKFDSAASTVLLTKKANPLAAYLPKRALFLVLGSIRQDEESAVLALIAQLRAQNPTCIIGLFPRHLERITPWRRSLVNTDTAFVLRSELTGPAEPGTIILWDVFGELPTAYGLAHRAFVGGSLAPLGGQNFLEPLTQGVLATVGPHTRNFDWIGEEIFEELVFKSAETSALAATLLAPAPPRREVRKKALDYIQKRCAETAKTAERIAGYLNRSPHA